MVVPKDSWTEALKRLDSFLENSGDEARSETMNGLTLVFNLETGEERWFSLPAKQAVVAAYASDRGDGNTWEYSNKNYPLVCGQYSIACGNWTATIRLVKDHSCECQEWETRCRALDKDIEALIVERNEARRLHDKCCGVPISMEGFPDRICVSPWASNNATDEVKRGR